MTEILLIMIAILTLAVVILAIRNAKIKRGSEPSVTKSDVDSYSTLVEKKKGMLDMLARQEQEKAQSLDILSQEIKEKERLFQKISPEVKRLEARFLELDRQLIDLELQKEDKDGAIQSRKNELNSIVNTIQKLIEEQKRKALEDVFYKVAVSEINRQRVQDIVTFAARFPEIKAPIMSAIYSYYYAAEVASMCNRVLGTGRRTGIYKITNSTNGMVYVGKSVDIRNRWTQHIKRAVGVEKETQNLLYPAMREYGVWNFSFEVLEDCLKEDLNTKEKFYQEVYKAKEDYSIK